MLKHAIDLNKYRNRDKTEGYHEEYQYINLLKDLMTSGTIEKGRNGNTLCSVGSAMHFSLENGQIPIFTTKKTAWKTCLKELLWFIHGKMDNKLLTQQNVHIWDSNSTPEFMESRGLSHYREGDLGSLYGHQWRFWNAKYEGCDADYTGKGIDQLQNAIDILKDPSQRTSRRIIVSAWNPEQVDGGVLPSCHNFFQFHVTNETKLSCTLYQRSCDEMCGIPFNVTSYSILTCIVAKICGLEPYEFIHFGGNCHIYEEHLDAMKEQIDRIPYKFPTLTILQKRDNINDYVVDDFKITDYVHHPPIKLTMVA